MTDIDESDEGFLSNFCSHLDISQPPTDVATDDDDGYFQCQGTTTVFGSRKKSKDCYHRRCYCVTRNESKPFPPSEIDVFSTTDRRALVTLSDRTYRICGRHTLKIPFDYLVELEKSGTDRTTQDILETLDGLQKTNDTELDNILVRFTDSIPQLQRSSGQQQAHRDNLKHRLEELQDLDPSEHRRREAQTVLDAITATVVDTSPADNPSSDLKTVRFKIEPPFT